MIQQFNFFKSNLKSTWKIRPALLWFLTIILVIGMFFRFVNLDLKTYWADEAYTSIYLSGYTRSEMYQQLHSGRVISLKDLQKYQHPNPEKSAVDTIRTLATEDRQHTPLYYVLTWFWIHLFGNSVAVTRSFSAFISLLTFPCLYWLCQELFESQVITWTAVLLIAVSPFHVLYAQEARPYSLLITTILISSAALLRAMRVKTKVSWIIYAVTVPLGLYTQIFFGLVAIGHGIYVAAIERLRLSKTLISYILASLAGLVAFLPWILVMIINAPSKYEAQGWADTKSSLLSSSIRWAGIFSRAFLDLGIGPDDSLKRQVLLVPFILILLSLITYSLYFLYCNTPKRVWLFVLTLIGVTGIFFMLLDFVLLRRYGTTRFLTACILGIQLSLAYLLATQTTSLSIRNRRQKLWQVIAALIISSGILSCAISSQAEVWWNKGPNANKYNSQIAEIVNQANRPLLVSDTDLILVQTLGYRLPPKVQFQLVAQSTIPEIPDEFSDVFLYYPSKALRVGLEKKYNSKIKRINEALWKLETPKLTN
jgi:uncharacterized membrane protein